MSTNMDSHWWVQLADKDSAICTSLSIGRSVLEILYFLSGPIIAICAWQALKQIKVGAAQVTATKKATQVIAQRESIRIAIEQAIAYADKVVPSANAFNQLRNDGKYPILNSCKIAGEWPNLECRVSDGPGLVEEIKSNDGLVQEILNTMEGIAMHFICGIADAKVAYAPLSKSFCGLVTLFLPYVIIANDTDKHFTNTLTLYGLWAGQDLKERTARACVESEKQLNQKKEQLSKITVPEYRPIGCAGDDE